MKVLWVIGVGILIVLAIAGLAVWWAYVLSILWTWFVVPLGVKAISIAHAYGLTLVVSGLMSSRGLELNSTKDKSSYANSLAFSIIAPAVLLLFGYVAVGFM